MLFKILHIIVPVLCFLIIAHHLTNVRKNRNFNIFFIIILLFVSIPRVLIFLDGMNTKEVLKSTFWNNLSLAYLYVLAFQWYFKVLLKKAYFTRISVFQIVFAFIMSILGFTDWALKDWSRSIFMLFSISIIIQIYSLVFSYINNVNKNNSEEKNLVSWLKIIFSTACILLFSSVFSVVYNGVVDVKIVVYAFRLNSILWLFVCLYVLFNPLTLFGRQSLENTLIKSKLVDFKVWGLAPLKSIDPRDQELYERMNSNVAFYLASINDLKPKNLKLFIIGKPIPVLSKVLSIPVIHLKFIFKYYCILTINEFHNYTKIKFAIQTIEEGYLDTHTVDSLSSFCGYSSRSAFYQNFKKFTGQKVTKFSTSNSKI